MSVMLLTQRLLEPDHFLSATEQAGEYIGQPEPASGNSGAFRLLSKGSIQDFSYSGTTTSNGAVDGTTVIDSLLSAFGDDYFIGGTVQITSGACNGETKSIIDFAQATGTLTTDAFSAQIVSGVTFTLTVAFETRDFRVQLVDVGDAGIATFKWSHDGGTTYLGRDATSQADWLAETEIHNTVNTTSRAAITEAANGNLVAVYQDSGDSNIYRKISTDRGITWGSAIQASDYSRTVKCLITLESGRLMLFLYGSPSYIVYSDDHGETWSSDIAQGSAYLYDVIELKNGNLYAVGGCGGDIYGRISSDGGMTWGDQITITTGGKYLPSIEQMENGDLICVYADDTGGSVYKIARIISTDGGASWGSQENVLIAAGGNGVWNPHIQMDINGDLFVVCEDRTGADYKIVMVYSTDRGDSWSAQADVKSIGSVDLENGYLALVGNELICSYVDSTNGDADLVRRGMWKAFSANACPCAIKSREQKLICDVGIVWHGGAGIADDVWSFETQYIHAMSHIIESSPTKAYRSTQDNINCAIVIDLGTQGRLFVDAVGFFGCNLRTLSFQMNSADSWGSPPVDEAVSFDVTTGGEVDSVEGNVIEDAALLAGYRDHALKANKHFLRMTDGSASGSTWEIKDNIGNYLIMDTTSALTGVGVGDHFAIFQDHIAKTFTGGLYRFVRMSIGAQNTSDGYYNIGFAVQAKGITLSRDFAVGYNQDHHYDIEMLRSPGGGMEPVKAADRKRIFSLTWPYADNTRQELLPLLDILEGKNLCLIPDHTDLKTCFLVKLIGDAAQAHKFLERFDIGPLLFEEVL